MNVHDLSSLSRSQIQSAGVRYIPRIDPEAPNLKIDYLIAAFEHLGRTERVHEAVTKLYDGMTQAWCHPPPQITKWFEKRKNTPAKLLDLLHQVRVIDFSEMAQWSRSLEGTITQVAKSTATLRGNYLKRKRGRQTSRESKASNTEPAVESSLEHGIMRLETAIEECESYIRSPAFPCLATNCLLLLGGWGMGKTHTLCDLTESRLQRGLPTLFVLAQNIPGREHPLTGISTLLGLESSATGLLDQLESMGEAIGQKVLLIVDGINEGDRNAWRNHIREIIENIGGRDHLGLVLSCRSPFEQTIFPDRSIKPEICTKIMHHGFSGLEFEAHVEYFRHYHLPPLTTPLLTPEFSRPLFLNLLCRSIAQLRRRDQTKLIRDISSGQKGMTFVFERFIKETGKKIESDFSLTAGACWNLIKGDSRDNENPGLTGLMASDLREHVPLAECLTFLNRRTQLPWDKCAELLKAFVQEGLLIETLRWSGDTWQEVIEFSFQRFGEHLICRHLFDNHLKTSSLGELKRCFYRNRPLGSIFEIDEYSHYYRSPGLATALMVDFPERIKRNAYCNSTELVDYLPKRALLVKSVADAFLESLLWRSVSTFTERTVEIVNRLIGDFDQNTQRQTFEHLLHLATKPNHPLSINYLKVYLQGLTIPERDLEWSEFLRTADTNSATYRVIAWAERKNDIAEDQAESLIQLLSLFLTVTARRLRDRATRAIFLCGWLYPRHLFDFALESLRWNDPYVPERVLAATYGVVMCRWADPNAVTLRERLPSFASSLVSELLRLESASLAHHSLIYGYAAGVVEAARNIDPDCIALGDLALFERPNDLLSPFIAPEEVCDSAAEDICNAIHMDFGNYTLGRLVSDRHDYQTNHVEFNQMKRQILGRIYEMGYDERYSQEDQAISRSRRWPDEGRGPVDRYGKKYSWIAFFEMHGLRDGAGLLDNKWESRTPDADIDPSFPLEPQIWFPDLPCFVHDSYSGAKAWLEDGLTPDLGNLLQREEVDGIEGPWVLLSGDLHETMAEDPRRRITWLQGIGADELLVDLLRNRLISEGFSSDWHAFRSDDYYTYAGEIPWSSKYGDSIGRNDKTTDPSALYTRLGGHQAVLGEGFALSHGYSWESHHSDLNQLTPIPYPAPVLADALGLRRHDRGTDLFDLSGSVATVYREFPCENYPFPSRLLYIRAELLWQYLASRQLVFACVAQGRRELDYEETDRLAKDPDFEWRDIKWRDFSNLVILRPAGECPASSQFSAELLVSNHIRD